MIKNIYIKLMFWFVKIVHLYTAGPERKIGLSYVNVVCVYGGRGGVGVRGLKMFCQRGQNFFCLLYVCVWGGGRSQVQYLSFREKNKGPAPSNELMVPITKTPKGHYVAYLS